jgi:glycosyltransferase involved in cell wall biosynthesis
MRNIRQISCIIPFWNEGRNLFLVLDELMKVKNLSEIICVDDASQDDNFYEVRSHYPRVKAIRLEENHGKSGAIKEGLKHATNEYVLLVDADLRNLNHCEIEKATEAFCNKDDLDMLILRRKNAIFFVKLYRADVLFTGERILRKVDLETVLNGSVNGWQLESAINTWMYLNGKNVLWIPHSGINTQKYLKWGVINGLKLDLKTYSDMISATGFNNMVKQILFFARNELRPNQNTQV